MLAKGGGGVGWGMENKKESSRGDLKFEFEFQKKFNNHGIRGSSTISKAHIFINHNKKWCRDITISTPAHINLHHMPSP